jgi:hypothetical protein
MTTRARSEEHDDVTRRMKHLGQDALGRDEGQRLEEKKAGMGWFARTYSIKPRDTFDVSSSKKIVPFQTFGSNQ